MFHIRRWNYGYAEDCIGMQMNSFLKNNILSFIDNAVTNNTGRVLDENFIQGAWKFGFVCMEFKKCIKYYKNESRLTYIIMSIL